MIRFLFIYFLFFLITLSTVIIGEFVSKRLPKSFFSRWWKKNIIDDCKECD
jgi:hypothetical protein